MHSCITGISVFRMCGRTADSSDVNLLLRSLCVHIVHLTSLDFNAIPHADADVKRFFVDILERGVPKGSSLGKNESFKGKIVIYLDDIDALSGVNVNQLDWLPKKLAPNIKVIVTLTSGDHVMLETARRKFKDDNVREVAPLSVNELCVSVLDNLRWRQRKLSKPQLHLVKEILAKCPTPLYAALLVEEAQHWTSYNDQISVAKHPGTVHACVTQIFDQLEKDVQPNIVTKVLALITLSQFGLSLAELEDILSLDDQFLNDVFAQREPDIRRAPFADIARIRYKLRAYLMMLQVDNTAVMTWKFKIFAKIARARYVKDADAEKELHKVMADYYLGSYASSKKKYHKGVVSPR